MMSSLPKLAVTMLFIATAAAYTPTLRLPTPTIYSRTAIHAISMGGVSDRMANDGLLYDGWGAKGLETLNSTATLQQLAEDREISRYDAVLIVAARAKEKAYQSVDEEEGRGYIGSSFGGPMGAGARKPLPAKSQVVAAVEELLGEVEETGELPELVTPGLPSEEDLDRWAMDASAAQGLDPAEAAAALAAAKGDAAAAEEMELDELEQEAAAGLAALLADEAFDDDFDDDEDPEASAEELIGGAAPAAAVAAPVNGAANGVANGAVANGADAPKAGIDALLDDILDGEDFDDDVELGEDGDSEQFADLFNIGGDGDASEGVEAGGMSPGDRG